MDCNFGKGYTTLEISYMIHTLLFIIFCHLLFVENQIFITEMNDFLKFFYVYVGIRLNSINFAEYMI